ncbi:DUF4160 domain-containing protein [Pseudomonas sp. NPDC090202]|uniref:DUF4160 domain-containing protein n=1 Tax=Pseudomonas sp. NPDC090202 TaxID=3364476 RepID=UPI0037F52D37
MPTIIRIGGLRVVIYPNDHRPAHVHVMRDGCEAVLILNCPDGPPTLRDSIGFKAHELGPIIDALAPKAQMTTACDKWSAIHGPHN